MNQGIQVGGKHAYEATDLQVTLVILPGGMKERLWPTSRIFPRQFWPDRYLVQEAARHAVDPGFSKLIVVCNKEHRFTVSEQTRAISIFGDTCLREPFDLNSAPATIAAVRSTADKVVGGAYSSPSSSCYRADRAGAHETARRLPRQPLRRKARACRRVYCAARLHRLRAPSTAGFPAADAGDK